MFQTFTAALSGVGSVLTIELFGGGDGGSEAFAAQNLVIEGDAVAAGLDDIIITEYVEGSGLNKAIELFNGTGSAVSLDGYTLEFFFNGSSSSATTISLDGFTIADGQTFVIADDDADAAILAVADLTSTSNFFNGDDAIVLSSNGVVVDAFGQVGVDPGTQWGSGDTGAQNSTLRRVVLDRDTDASDAFDPADQWAGFGNDVFDDLGNFDDGRAARRARHSHQ